MGAHHHLAALSANVQTGVSELCNSAFCLTCSTNHTWYSSCWSGEPCTPQTLLPAPWNAQVHQACRKTPLDHSDLLLLPDCPFLFHNPAGQERSSGDGTSMMYNCTRTLSETLGNVSEFGCVSSSRAVFLFSKLFLAQFTQPSLAFSSHVVLQHSGTVELLTGGS